jgi:hypothetical protein
MGDSLVAGRVVPAAADRGVTAVAHAGMHARTHTQTPAALSNTRCGDSVRHRPADGSTRKPAVPKPTCPPVKDKANTLSPAVHTWWRHNALGQWTHGPLALLLKPPNTALQPPAATLPPLLSDVRAPPPPTNESVPLAVFLKPPDTVAYLAVAATLFP